MNKPLVKIGTTVSWCNLTFRVTGFEVTKRDEKIIRVQVLLNADERDAKVDCDVFEKLL